MRFECKKTLTKQRILSGCITLLLVSLSILYKNGFICRHCPHIPFIQPKYLPKEPPAAASDVLLLGYMRGGSTFIGEILGIRKNQFYVYEPLHRMAKHQYFKPGYICNIMNTNCLISNKSENKAINILQAIYNCDHRTFQEDISSWQLQKAKFSELEDCEHRDPLCWSQILTPCHTAFSIVSKVLRLTVGLASRLLDKLPNLKIVHLLRDPRAIIDLRLRGNRRIKHDEIKSLCNKIRQDCKDAEQIRLKHPGGIHRIFYEDIATNPMVVSKLFDDIGFSFEMNEFLHRHASTKYPEQENRFNTARINSSQTARKWRQHIPWHVVKLVNIECTDVFDLLGYPHHKTKEDLLNETIPLRN